MGAQASSAQLIPFVRHGRLVRIYAHIGSLPALPNASGELAHLHHPPSTPTSPCTPSSYFCICCHAYNIKCSQGGSLPGLTFYLGDPSLGQRPWLGTQVTQLVAASPSGDCLPEPLPHDLTSHAWLGPQQLVTCVTHGSFPRSTGQGCRVTARGGPCPGP